MDINERMPVQDSSSSTQDQPITASEHHIEGGRSYSTELLPIASQVKQVVADQIGMGPQAGGVAKDRRLSASHLPNPLVTQVASGLAQSVLAKSKPPQPAGQRPVLVVLDEQLKSLNRDKPPTRKSTQDNIAKLQDVLAKDVEMLKKAEANPDKANRKIRDNIRQLKERIAVSNDTIKKQEAVLKEFDDPKAREKYEVLGLLHDYRVAAVKLQIGHELRQLRSLGSREEVANSQIQLERRYKEDERIEKHKLMSALNDLKNIDRRQKINLYKAAKRQMLESQLEVRKVKIESREQSVLHAFSELRKQPERKQSERDLQQTIDAFKGILQEYAALTRETNINRRKFRDMGMVGAAAEFLKNVDYEKDARGRFESALTPYLSREQIKEAFSKA